MVHLNDRAEPFDKSVPQVRTVQDAPGSPLPSARTGATSAGSTAVLLRHSLAHLNSEMDLWSALQKNSDHVLDGEGKSTNQGVASRRTCEATHHRYLEDVEAWDGDEDATSKSTVVTPSGPAHGRRCTMR